MHVEMTNIMKFISISRLFIYIIVGKLYSRVVLILGGLRYVWVGGGGLGRGVAFTVPLR